MDNKLLKILNEELMEARRYNRHLEKQVQLSEQRLDLHSQEFKKRSVLYDKQQKMLDKHSTVLDQHTKTLEQHFDLLNQHKAGFEIIMRNMTRMEERLDKKLGN